MCRRLVVVSDDVSVLFNEPKLLKSARHARRRWGLYRFSALQRAEIAEIRFPDRRAFVDRRFSALQRAEIAEIRERFGRRAPARRVSVLFNEPKLLKCTRKVSSSSLSSEFQCSSTSRNC